MQAISCTIDILTDTEEACWLITVSDKYAAQAALLFSGLHFGLISEIRFQDSRAKETVTIHADTVTLGSQTLSITLNWFQAIWHLFLNTALNGWTDTAHIDETIPSANGDVCLTITISP